MPAAASAPADDTLCQSGALTADDGAGWPRRAIPTRGRPPSILPAHRRLPSVSIARQSRSRASRSIRDVGGYVIPVPIRPTVSKQSPNGDPVAQAICPANDRSAAQHRRSARDPREAGRARRIDRFGACRRRGGRSRAPETETNRQLARPPDRPVKEHRRDYCRRACSPR